MRPYRSLLFVPGHKPAWAVKAVKSGADAVVLDLEDSVPAAEKEAARATVAATIAEVRGARTPDVGLFVRPNALGTRLAGGDLEAVVVPGLTGLFVPKIEKATDVLQVDALVDHFETRNGVSGVEYVVPVETVPAIQNCREIARASPRVGAMVGPTAEHADIAREVGYEWTPEGLETLYLRSRVLLACREAGLHALTGLWEDLADLDGLATFARARPPARLPRHDRHPSVARAGRQRRVHPVRRGGRVLRGTGRGVRGRRRARRGRRAVRPRAHRQGALRQGRPVVGDEAAMTMRGLYFEEFEIGKVYKHPFTRTVTEMDNILFTSLTMNLQPLHLDEEFSKKTIHGQRVFNSLFTVALIGAFHVPELTMGTTLGNLGYDEIKFPHPVFHGDTLRGETTILDKRESKSRTDSGIVWFEHRGYNQHDTLILTCKRVGLMMTRPTQEEAS